MGLAFLPNLIGPDGILILLIVLLLFGARNIPTFMRGMDRARREFFGNEDDDEPDLTRVGRFSLRTLPSLLSSRDPPRRF